MKRTAIFLFTINLLVYYGSDVFSQQISEALASISASDLESHLSFLASPLLKGRLNGGEGLDIAANYIASQAHKIGLKPANGNSYFYPYYVVEKSFDRDKTQIIVSTRGVESEPIREPIYQIYPMGPANNEIEGEIVFAGYGIRTEKYNYNDFDTISLNGKIVLILDRAPSTPDGNMCLFEDQRWMSVNGLQMKIQGLMYDRPKAILIVPDPKSGRSSLEESSSGLAGYLASSMALKGHEEIAQNIPGAPVIMYVHRKVANEILKGTGMNIADLQNAIDRELKPHSFAVRDKILKISEVSLTEEKKLPIVAGIVEGSDPVLKEEVVIFSGHMDHIGGEGANINPGADDNASGCSALLELAEAFQLLKTKPLRSVLFLWVSGEEVGLFGSEFYVENPIFPLAKTVADLNMDMIGRVKGIADTTDQTPMTGPNAVFVITGNQSRELVSIVDNAAKKTNLVLDYSLSGTNHPLMLFARSDHYNFVQKDIPVLFFSTGLHTDYHKPGDVIEKINFGKMELITRTMFLTGYQVANRKNRIIVDNPFSKWTRNSSGTGR
jgi:hypothetical protein